RDLAVPADKAVVVAKIVHELAVNHPSLDAVAGVSQFGVVSTTERVEGVRKEIRDPLTHTEAEPLDLNRGRLEAELLLPRVDGGGSAYVPFRAARTSLRDRLLLEREQVALVVEYSKIHRRVGSEEQQLCVVVTEPGSEGPVVLKSIEMVLVAFASEGDALAELFAESLSRAFSQWVRPAADLRQAPKEGLLTQDANDVIVEQVELEAEHVQAIQVSDSREFPQGVGCQGIAAQIETCQAIIGWNGSQPLYVAA